MHDLILAKEISNLVNSLIKKHKFSSMEKVSIEVGDVKKIHCHTEGECHDHDIKISNLKFHLNNFHPDTKFSIRRSEKFEGWKLKDIEGE